MRDEAPCRRHDQTARISDGHGVDVNRVVLDDEMSCIESKATGERVLLKETGGTYVFEVEGQPFVTTKAVGFARRGR